MVFQAQNARFRHVDAEDVGVAGAVQFAVGGGMRAHRARRARLVAVVVERQWIESDLQDVAAGRLVVSAAHAQDAAASGHLHGNREVAVLVAVVVLASTS